MKIKETKIKENKIKKEAKIKMNTKIKKGGGSHVRFQKIEEIFIIVCV